MTFEQFDAIVAARIKVLQETMATKGMEYANSELDRLANFKKIAEEIGLTPLRVWSVYFKKHTRAIDSYVRTGQIYSAESITGRINDAIAYLLLLEGLVVDGKINEQSSVKCTCKAQSTSIDPKEHYYSCATKWTK